MNYKLTKRQQEILGLIVKAASNPQIGKALALSPQTVNNHLRVIFAKLGVNSRTEAAVKAVRERLIVDDQKT